LRTVCSSSRWNARDGAARGAHLGSAGDRAAQRLAVVLQLVTVVLLIDITGAALIESLTLRLQAPGFRLRA
jgi:hypothetical protein